MILEERLFLAWPWFTEHSTLAIILNLLFLGSNCGPKKDWKYLKDVFKIPDLDKSKTPLSLQMIKWILARDTVPVHPLNQLFNK